MGLLCVSAPSLAQDYAWDQSTPRWLESADEKQKVIQALQAIDKGQWTKAKKLVVAAQDPLLERLYYWFYYTKGRNDVQFERVSAFVKQNPDWPKRGLLIFEAEKAMSDRLSAWDIIEWFTEHEPRTADGMALYLRALDAIGLRHRKKDVFREWWATTLLATETQTEFLNKYGRLLDTDTNARRLDLLLQHDYYTNARNLAATMQNGYATLIEARIALATNTPGVDALIGKVPARLMRDPGLTLDRIKWRREHDDDFGAMELLHYASSDNRITNQYEWWHERHVIIRRLIEKKQYESAYVLASRHIQTDGFGFAQAEFLCGWLSLRFLNKPDQAFVHFERLYKNVSMPISLSRGAYWTGRASQAMGRKDVATQWYRIAARYETTFYGQRALDILQQKPSIKDPVMQPIDPRSAAQFYSRDMVQIAMILHEAGLREETTDFLDALIVQISDHKELDLLARLSVRFNHLHNAIRLSKRAMGKTNLPVTYAYPTILSKVSRLNMDIDWGLVHALIRQESEFNHTAQSPAGARGLMQLMPSTAAGVARKHSMKYSKAWLTQRPEYNVSLGAYYIREMLDRFDQSAPLAIASYNAGPGRVSRWLREIGDPRTSQIDMIDWIEMIPIYETRNYVQRVMEGWYVYQHMFNDMGQCRTC